MLSADYVGTHCSTFVNTSSGNHSSVFKITLKKELQRKYVAYVFLCLDVSYMNIMISSSIHWLQIATCYSSVLHNNIPLLTLRYFYPCIHRWIQSLIPYICCEYYCNKHRNRGLFHMLSLLPTDMNPVHLLLVF